MWKRGVLGLCLGVLVTAGLAQEASLQWLSPLPSGSWSLAKAVNDQAQVVGIATNASDQRRAVRWQNGIVEDLGTLGGMTANAYGISADGQAVAGVSADSNEAFRAFRWSAGVMTDLGTLGGDFSMAQAISADGRVVVGGATNAQGYPRAFRWTAQTGMVDIGTLGGTSAYAYTVDATGETIAGYSLTAEGHLRAFRWRAGHGMEALGTLGGESSEAYAISTDGQVIVGIADTASGQSSFAFRWTERTGMQPIHPLDAPNIILSAAYGVNADGTVIVGYFNTSGPYPRRNAFRWIEGIGLEDLNTTYADLLAPGDQLVQAFAVSPNGRYIAGVGWHQGVWQAFLLDTGRCYRRVDVNRDGLVDDADLLGVLFDFGTAGDDLQSDIDRSGLVDDADLLAVLFAFGQGC